VITGMELSDREQMLLAFANLAGRSAGDAQRGGRTGRRVSARHSGGLGSYVFWQRDDDASFDPTGRSPPH
jgi:hypothetical protein